MPTQMEEYGMANNRSIQKDFGFLGHSKLTEHNFREEQ